MEIKVKRIYEQANRNDGVRILVDRLWPRGVSKEKARLDEWLKDIGPTDELRKWFDHDPNKFADFKSRYKEQLKSEKRAEALRKIKRLAEEKQTTLLTASKEETYNHAQVIREVIKKER